MRLYILVAGWIVFATSLTNAQPPNDFCNAAQVITLGSTVAFDTSNATSDGITSHCGFSQTRDVWYEFTAPSTLDYVFSLCGSNYNTVIAIWGTDTCPLSSDLLACNDDMCGTRSEVTVALASGTTVLIQATKGLWGSSGSGQLLATFAGPLDLSCSRNPGSGIIELNWTNPQSYDSINVYVNGSLDSTVPGGTIIHATQPVPLGVDATVCIEGVVGGVASLQECCTINDACSSPVPISSGTVLPFNTTFATPDGVAYSCNAIAATTPDIWYSYTASETFEVTFSLCGSSYNTSLAVWSGGTCPNPSDLITCNNNSCVLSSEASAIIPAGTTVLLQVGGSMGAALPAIGSGQIEITENVPPVLNLTCSTAGGSGIVDVSWSNPTAYDALNVYINSTLHAVLPGNASGMSTPVMPTGSTATVCVEGERNGEVSSLECCFTHLADDYTGQAVIHAGESSGLSNFSGLVDSVTAIYNALLSNGYSPVIVHELAGIGGTPTLVYLALGTYPRNHVMSASEGATVAALVQNGVPVVVEGGDVWGFDPLTPFGGYDGVHDTITHDGDDSLASLSGLAYGSADMTGHSASYTHDNTGDEYTDRLTTTTTDLAGPNAGVIWEEGNGAYNTGVFYDTDPGFGKVICQSWEFGGHGGNQVNLMSAMLSALGLTLPQSTFVRGDGNVDGTVDISDAVHALNALFVPGTPSPLCVDSADANDDGNHDIADAVFLLAWLFLPGSQPLPPPGACGTDPTADSLSCTQYPPCP